LSDALSAVIATVSELDVEGTVKVFTVGSVVSPAAGKLEAFPGKVLALISATFE
jgi:hypothetical protein